jgi:hypothetical protein
LQQRNPESGGLAASSWSAREDVVARESDRNGRSLDGGRLFVMKIFDAAKNGGVQREFGKNGDV